MVEHNIREFTPQKHPGFNTGVDWVRRGVLLLLLRLLGGTIETSTTLRVC
jgi:hypothetical protein